MSVGLGHVPVLAAWVLLASLAASADAAPRHAKARALERSHAAAASALSRARALRAGHGVVTGRELTPALAELSARYEALDPAERRDADRLLARPTDGPGDPQAHGYAVPEHAPFCTANFCVHWVTSTGSTPDLTDGDVDDVPDVVEDMAAELQAVRASENVTLGWSNPLSDGVRGGGTGRLDVYVGELAGAGVLGYAATDPGQSDPHHKFAYMVVDDDYAGQGDPLDGDAGHRGARVQPRAAVRLRRRAGHVDVQGDGGLDGGPRLRCRRPATSASSRPGRRSTRSRSRGTFQDKHYGSAVWNMWLDARHGPVF